MGSDFEKLKGLLLKEAIAKIDEIYFKIEKLENFQEKEALIENFSSLISEILSKNIKDNQNQIYLILHPLISKALRSDLENSKWELSKLLSPIITSSMKEQVNKQKDSIVDALYPIMGNMISKYVSQSFKEMIYEINEKLQNSLSLATIKRKIKSKVYNLSEAELMIREVNFAKVKSIFLIHRESGLLIVDLHQDGNLQINEPQMVASMLSAIRSFINDWISNNNKMSEINDIAYGDSSIVIESAGSCYLAIVIKGDVNFELKENISSILSEAILTYPQEISEFDGDTSKLNIENIKTILAKLFYTKNLQNKNQDKKFPIFGFLFILFLFILPFSFLGVDFYKKYQIEKNEKYIKSIIKTTTIKIYDLEIKTDEDKKITVDGVVLNQKEKKDIYKLLENLKIINNISSVDDTFMEGYLNIEIKKIIKYFNQKYNTDILYKISENFDEIKFKATFINLEAKEDFTSTMEELFSDKKFDFDIKELPKFNERVYFELSSDVVLEKYNKLLDSIASLINNNSGYLLKITGYTDDLGSLLLNKKLSLDRATNVKNELVKRGIDGNLIIIDSTPFSPKDIMDLSKEKQKELSRCVIFNWEMKKSDK